MKQLNYKKLILPNIPYVFFVYLVFVAANAYLGFDLTSNLYLVLIFIVYVLISAGQVRKYEAL